MLYKKTPPFTATQFNSFLQNVLTTTQNPILHDCSFSLYWLDIADIPIVNGRRQLAPILDPVKNEKGIYIFFKKDTFDVLSVGYAGTGNGPASVLYTTVVNNQGGSGRIEQLLKQNPNNNSGIVSYFQNNISGKSWNDFMNEHSILLVCVRSDNSVNQALLYLRKQLRTTLNPLANT